MLIINHPTINWNIRIHCNDNILVDEITKVFCGFKQNDTIDLTNSGGIDIWIDVLDNKFSVNIEHLEYQEFSNKNLMIQWLYEICFHHTCLKADNWTFFHGAVVKNQKKQAILLFGKTHAGKSTLTAALCLTRRYKYMSDDIVPLKLQSNQLYANSFPKAIMIRDVSVLPNSIYRYKCGSLEYPNNNSSLLINMYDDSINCLLPLPVEAVFFLNRTNDHISHTIEIPTNEVKFSYLFESVRNPNDGKSNFEIIQQIMKLKNCYVINYYSSSDAIKAIDCYADCHFTE